MTEDDAVTYTKFAPCVTLPETAPAVPAVVVPALTESMNTLADRLRDLRETEEKFRMTIANSTDPKVVVDTMAVWKRYSARIADAQAEWNIEWLRQVEYAAQQNAANALTAVK